MTERVTVQAGETWCSIAVAAGFRDCRRVRGVGANAPFANRQLVPGDVVIVPDLLLGGESRATERRHFFRRRGVPFASIRFVHGSFDRKFADDITINELNVSNYETDLAGADGTAAFVNDTVRRFDADAHEDEDAFKVEVLDTRTGRRDLPVTLEALRPTYDALGIALTGHIEFTGADLAARSLNAVATKQGVSRRFRTCYLRLVVDNVDHQVARPLQTLLVTDMVASGDRRVEILDQDVRATYELDTCRSAPRCLINTTAPIGRGSTVDLAVRVLRAAPSGVVENTVGGPGDNGAVPLSQVRDRVLTFCRRYWAQAHVRFNLARLETVDLPSNMITVADATANLATGRNPAGTAAGQIGFTVRVQRFGAANSTHVVAPFNVPAGNTPEQTAGLIKNAIDALPGLSATVDVNPPEFGDPVYVSSAGTNGGSVDVLLTDSTGGRVTITNLTSLANQDAAQIIASVNLTMTITFRNSAADYHVGHPQQRNLVKALNTGDQVIDIHVVNSVPGVRGFTVPEQSDLILDRRPVSGPRNSLIMPINSTNGTVNNPFSFPHEIGHVLTDNGLHSSVLNQLMRSGTDPVSSAVNDSKRIWGRAIVAQNWQVFIQNADGSLSSNGTINLNAVARIQATSADLLH